MNLRLRRGHQQRHDLPDHTDPAHVMTSGFDTSICRFVLECTCGDHFDTRYIDEALEYRELHTTLAPLADALPPH
jgi:hypothetical protein